MSILKKPLVTEKVSALNKYGVYGLIVDNRAGKQQIRKEIERFYGVTVDKINTMRYAGKSVTRHTKSHVMKGKKPSYKKVLVTLKAGDIIDFYSNF
ncbi:MAG: 50S ribosomal protein L23 [Candidatus Cardinium sp.]|uniref:50S ribosomal protein L23 n=1 Tax=Cardinium endosymbiont of Dermatophagoides farinae TaxID=2597823 RepID=UPI001183E48F|nr:50S ribosomal protein L23 [Cardinium endosymbiont of Dermatophagoides farinae]TSJ81209.1 50S ribosomal protein L23 [Cardinium endosymbiont of Dermatophagoides farinae]UWW97259.1 MAG: 50S ribosomal protein L23 [Candidatus Cardinium sp.]